MMAVLSIVMLKVQTELNMKSQKVPGKTPGPRTKLLQGIRSLRQKYNTDT